MTTTTILIVDDTPDVLDLYSVWLRQAGYEVLQASTGREGLRLVAEKLPDLILLDVMLPDVDGIEVCKTIKANEQTAGIPIINVSGKRLSADSQAESLEAGADGYLIKPVEARTLLAHVTALLRMRRTEEALWGSEERFRAVFDNALDAMLIANDDANYVDANPSACAMFGVSKEEMLQRKVSDFVEPDRRHEVEKVWQSFLQEGEQTGEFRLYRPDGTTRELEYRAKAEFLPNRHLSVLRDVTQRKQAEEELRRTHAELEKRVEQRTAELIASNTFLKSEILERREAQEALAASEEKYRDLFENAKDAIYVHDLDGKYLSVNRAAEKLSGYTREEILGKQFADFVAPEYLNDVRENLCTKLHGQTETSYEVEIIRKDGQRLPLELNSNLIFRNGAAVGIQGVARDITERKRAEDALRIAQARTESILASIADSHIFLDTSWHFLYVNEAAIRSIARPREEILGLTLWDVFPDIVGTELDRQYRRAMDEGVPVSLDFHYLTNDSWWALRFYPAPDGLAVFATDITDRRRAEEALKQSEEKYRSLVEDVPDVTWLSDREGNTSYISPNVEKVFGYTPEEIYAGGGELWFGAIHPDDLERVKSGYDKLFTGEASFDIEYRVKKRNESWIWIRDRASTFEEKEVKHAHGTFTDITERKKLQDRLERSEEKYRELVENINDIIYATDNKGIITYISQAVERTIGFNALEIIGQPFTKFIHAEEQQLALQNFQQSAAGVSNELEFRVVDKSGGIRWVRKSSRPIFHGKQFMGTRGLVTDVTERKQAEASRMQLLQRLVTAQEEEQRRLSRELHDQTGQSLAALMLGLKSIEDSGQLRETARNRLRQLQELTDQLARDVHQLASNLRPTALDDMGLHTALSHYVEEWSDRTKIRADFHSNGLMKERLPRQIETAVYRIVQEALTNVVKHANAQNVSVILEYRGNRMQAIVEDDGCGFDSERLAKARNGDRRLGLLGMQERVALVEGHLNIESTPASGTTVIVHIPVLTEQTEANTK